ncbi:Putative helicase and subunit of the Nrd1 complex [Komagataella phaffii]|nr:GQ67_00648T0 [Komagataella phaffii]AOA67454.1 GQ68_00740T0 [Komagataella phaffii GS115]CAH2448245.1 Putative DNA/RNA helicase [Komagataella phaffii CBS 7435]
MDEDSWSELVRSIDLSHKEVSNDQLQEKVLASTFQYLTAQSPERIKHLFCDEKNYPIAIHSLILFSFDTTPVLEWYTPKIDYCLNTCQRCISMFHKGRAKLRQDFIVTRGLDPQSVSRFMDIILNWELNRILIKFRNAITSSNGGRVQVTTELSLSVVECLYGCAMLRLSPELRTLFSTIFSDLVETQESIVPSNSPAFPGVIFFLFEGTDFERNWALSVLKSFDSRKLFIEWDLLQLEEYEVHFYRIQDPSFYNSLNCANFWCNILPLIEYTTVDNLELKLLLPASYKPMLKEVRFQIVSLDKVLINHVMSYLDYPLPFVLRALNIFLQKFSFKFWSVVAPHTFFNFMDAILGSPHFLKLLKELETKNCFLSIDKLSSKTPSFNDLIEWIPAMFKSLQGPSQQQMIIKASVFIWGQRDINISYVIELTLPLVLDCLLIQTPIYDSTFNIDVLTQSETRVFLDNNFHVVLDSTIATESPKLMDMCCELVRELILFDSKQYASSSYNLNLRKPVKLVNFLPKFWSYLSIKIPPSNLQFTSTVLESLKFICGVFVVGIGKQTPPPPGKQDERDNLLSIISKHNKNTELFFTQASQLLSTLVTFDPSVLRTALNGKQASIGYWSCILSSNQELYQSAANVLYEAFDVEGRLEGTRALLELNLQICLQSVVENLNTLLLLKVYELCPRTLRVLMDLLHSLCDPVTGVFIENNSYDSKTRESILSFWNVSWDFLCLIYDRTTYWASIYSVSVLIDFARDTLDTSHLLLDGFRSFMNVVSDKPEIKNFLFDKIMLTFHKVLTWLRLGDESLLTSCLSLVMKTLNLATELELPFDNDIIELLAKYGARAKKFNNKLSETQQFEILERARDFNSDLVNSIVAEAEEYRNSKFNLGSVESPISIPDEKPVKKLQSDLSKYIKYVKEQDVPAIMPGSRIKEIARLSAKEKAERDIRIKRMGKPEKAPAAPRPPGFNSSKKKRAEDSSDDEDEEDQNDNALDTLFHPNVEELKSKTARNLREKGKMKAQLLSMDRPKVNAAEMERKKAEYRMRMRLNVDMNPLYAKVLQWSFKRDSRTPDNADLTTYKAISDSYDSVEQYQNTFEPLLLLECWQGIQQAKETGQDQPFNLVVGSKTTTGNFFDVYASVKKSVLQDRKIGDNDLVVLAYVPDGLKNMQGLDESVPRTVVKTSEHSCLGKVREIKYSNSEFCDVTIRVHNRNNISPFLTSRSELTGLKILQMVTIEREYSSLKGLPFYDLSDKIVKAKSAEPFNIDDTTLQETMVKFRVNKSQAQAIAGASTSSGFSLIQGPPGTGKTKTILGIVGKVLTTRNNLHSTPISIPGAVTSGPRKPETGVRKVLVCAPSNAAVDELVIRLREGVPGISGQMFKPKVVRLGRSDAINSAVKDLTLEELVDAELNETARAPKADQSIREKHNKVLAERNSIREALKEVSNLKPEEVKDLQKRYSEITKAKNELGKKLDEQREEVSVSYRNREIQRRAVQFRILSQAQIICSTLSGSAHDFLATMDTSFDTVVIDEACQCIELSAIIPLRYGCKRCIMVGDPNQLPPTVLSQAAAEYKYEQSLFVRMMNVHPKSVYLLNVQYRMHPQISVFPSKEFYNGKLIDGEGTETKNTRSWHKKIPPYCFIDVTGKESTNTSNKSLFNRAEAQAVVSLIDALLGLDRDFNFASKIGVISPYKQQVVLLRDMILRKFGRNIGIDVNTVDGFQGQEKDVILFSCVRADETKGVGFLADVRRLNVALTRAKSTLLIVGHASNLSGHSLWRHLVQDSKDRNVFFTQRSLLDGGKGDVTVGVLPSGKGKRKIEGILPPEKRKNTTANRNTDFKGQLNNEQRSKFKGQKNGKKSSKDFSNVTPSNTGYVAPPTKGSLSMDSSAPQVKSGTLPSKPTSSSQRGQKVTSDSRLNRVDSKVLPSNDFETPGFITGVLPSSRGSSRDKTLPPTASPLSTPSPTSLIPRPGVLPPKPPISKLPSNPQTSATSLGPSMTSFSRPSMIQSPVVYNHPTMSQPNLAYNSHVPVNSGVYPGSSSVNLPIMNPTLPAALPLQSVSPVSESSNDPHSVSSKSNQGYLPPQSQPSALQNRKSDRQPSSYGLNSNIDPRSGPKLAEPTDHFVHAGEKEKKKKKKKKKDKSSDKEKSKKKHKPPMKSMY